MELDVGEDECVLESYLQAAPVDRRGVFMGGGGHASKQLVVVRGGIGCVAKLAMDETQARQARAEVISYRIARALGWDDLVPCTVLREVPSDHGSMEASVQVLWPTFRPQAEAQKALETYDAMDVWRAALLDVVLMNPDRQNDGNWGVAADALALVDHGHALFPPTATQVSSSFVAHLTGQDIPDELLAPLADLDANDRLLELCADQTEVDAIGAAVLRAEGLAAGGQIG